VVYFYSPYCGSVDIDAVGPSLKGAFEEIIEGYEGDPQHLQAINPEYRLETLRKLQKLVPTAQALVEETDDKDLYETVAATTVRGRERYESKTMIAS
jgi:hypothetical protein